MSQNYIEYFYLSASMIGFTPTQPTNLDGINQGQRGFGIQFNNLTSLNAASDKDVDYEFYRLAMFQKTGKAETFDNGQWYHLQGYIGTAADPSTDPNPANWVTKTVQGLPKASGVNSGTSAMRLNPKPDLVSGLGQGADYIVLEVEGTDGNHLVLKLGTDFDDLDYAPKPTWMAKDPHSVVFLANEAGAKKPFLHDNLREGFKDVLCFVEGTALATPEGEVAIETLQIGDLLIRADGGVTPVVWIGTKRVTVSYLDQMPVRIAAGALGAGQPSRDLYVSPNHGMILDGMVVNASALLNGASIRFATSDELPAAFTYYHIETEAHDEILANGAVTETYVDFVERQAFDNYDEYLALTGGVERVIAAMPRARISSPRHLPQDMMARFDIVLSSLDDEVDALIAA